MQAYPLYRPRRSRRWKWSRELFSESKLCTYDLIQPFFLLEGKNKEVNIEKMPGIQRYSMDRLFYKLEEVEELKIPLIAIFPCLDDHLKTKNGEEALNENGLICSAIREIKKRFPGIGVMADVALDPYTNHGQDGLIDEAGNAINDKTVRVLCKQAQIQAEAGADVIAPSDMMDGRILAIRKTLEDLEKTDTLIMSYAAKYASAFYGPFRDAVSSKLEKTASKETYQMDPRNSDEALREATMDIFEGADMLLVKPGLPYLDIVHRLNASLNMPIFSYQVSGEYAMLKSAVMNSMLDEKDTVLESLACFKRAGSTGIISYFSMQAAKWLLDLEK